MPSRVSLLMFLVCSVGLTCARVQGQFTTINQTQHGEANAALAWTSGAPPSTASNTQTLNGPGILNVPAIANNFGITSVSAAASAQTQLDNLPDGYRLSAQGYVSGHSNLAAFASASYSSYTHVEFDLIQPVDALLSLQFLNLIVGSPGVGGGQSSMQLVGPGNVTLFSYTHTAIGSPYQFTEILPLLPGTYTLRVDSGISQQFAVGLSNHVHTSLGIVTLTLPGPGGFPLIGMVGFISNRRRR